MKGCRSCNNWQAQGTFLDREDPATAGQKAELGLCRRYAPRPTVAPAPSEGDSGAGSEVAARWPLVASDDWCGEWDPRLA